MSEFRVGDRVTVHTEEKGPQSMATVERFVANGKCMELSDGSKWRADGKRLWHYKGSFYRGPWVEPAMPGDDEHIGKRRAIGLLRKWTDGLTMDTPLDGPALHRILELVEKERAAAGDLPRKD